MKTGKTYLLFAGVLCITLFSWISSCTHEANIDKIPVICFESDVLPVFQTSCAISGCHDGNGESDLILTSYLPISHAVEPGKPYSSELYKAIITKTGEDKMPPDRPLSLENRTKIRLWIEQGANLTTCQDQTGPGGNGGSSYVNPLACFSRDILPVINSRCASAGCHDAITHEEGFVFSSYNTTMTAVKPGNPAESKLYKVITKTTGDDKMPPPGSPQLTVAEIDSIRAWISYGALNQFCGETCDTINPVTFSGTIWPAVQQSCTGCHSGASPSGGILLANYNYVAVMAANGNLLNSLRGTGVTKMPPGGVLSRFAGSGNSRSG
jgi:mono/diheme cytochrome c family protein